MQELATLASARAEDLSDAADAEPRALANLYSGLAGVSSKGILDAVKDISSIPEAELSPRDRALRQAATVIAEEVLRAPEPESLTQATVSNVKSEISLEENVAGTGSGESPFAVPASDAALKAAQPEPQQTALSAESPADPVHDAFLSTGRSKLDEIDSLLKEEDKK
jgi:chemotaxis protein MotC